MTREITIDYEPYSKQQQFHDSDKKHRAFIGGLGSGKTMAGSAEAIRTMIQYPDCLGAILAPTYPLLRDSTIRTVMSMLPRELIADYNKSEQHLYLINGAECIFRPCDDVNSIDRLRNINLGWAWMDEASLSPEYAFRVLLGRLRDARGPMRTWLTTTPKGYNWIWVRWVKDPKESYYIVTSSSRENPYLPKEYIESLTSEYTGVFAKQEIEGLFVGHEGLVYPGFNRETHLINTDEIAFKEFKVGVDFGFTNPSVMLKIGFDYDGRAYIMKEFYQSKITDAELAERAFNKFGTEAKYFADPSNPGGIEEFKKMNLECKGAERIKGEGETSFIVSGIKYISSLLEKSADGKPRLMVNPSCVNTIMEFENYSYPDEKEEKPVDEKPLKIHDHCLVKGTMIAVEDGWRDIVDVKVGDHVLTRAGYKRVLKSGKTLKNQIIFELLLSNGLLLRGTGNHPVFVKYGNKGLFLRMDSLRNTYILEDINSNQWKSKQWNLTESYSVDTQTALATLTGDTIDQTASTSKQECKPYIEKSGRNTTEKSQKDTTSIISTGIQTTTKSKTSNVSHQKNTQNLTKENENTTSNISKEYDHSQRNGMGVRKAKNGTGFTERKHGKAEKQKPNPAQSAENYSNTISRDPSIVRVLANRELSEREDVYDLTIEGAHEFYANGILVHNSMDALRYCLVSREKEIIVDMT